MFTQENKQYYTRSYLIAPEFTGGVENVRLYAEVSEIDVGDCMAKNIIDKGLVNLVKCSKYKVNFFISIDNSNFRSFNICLPLLNVEEWSEEQFDEQVRVEIEGVVDMDDFHRDIRIYQENI